MKTPHLRNTCVRYAVTALVGAALGTSALPCYAEATQATRAGAVELVDRAAGNAHLRAATRDVGGFVVEGFAPDAAPESTLGVPGRTKGPGVGAFVPFFPATYSDPFVVEGAGVRVVLRATGAAGAAAEVSDGKIIYRSAYELTDSVHAVDGGRTEELLLLHSEQAPTRFDYEILSVDGATRVEIHRGGVRFTDDAGRGLEIEPPWVMDARGERRDGAVRWVLGKQSADGVRRLRLVLRPGGLEYPLAIDPSWTTTGSMGRGHSGHSATLLQNGKVLVAGGFFADALSSAEIYDPTTGYWSDTGNLITGRTGHTATLLTNGKVLIVGGTATAGPPAPFASAEIYDPATGLWSTTGSMATARIEHTATLLPSGKVLVAGGYSGTTLSTFASAEIYDPATGSWSAATSMGSARSQHTATLLPNGKVLVVGGFNNGARASAEVFDPTTNGGAGSWTGTDSLRTARRFHSAVLLATGKVLVMGGDNTSVELASSEVYDPSAGTWRSTGSLTTARTGFSTSLLPNGTVLVAGGYSNATSLASVEIYDPAASSGAGSWSSGTSLASARIGHSGTLLPSGKVLVAGGHQFYALASSEVYDPVWASWTDTGSVIFTRHSHTLTLLPNGKVLMAGGHTGGTSGTTLLDCELYDPATGAWSSTGSMLARRSSHLATLLPTGKVLVFGGYSGTTHLNSAELYDPASGTWSTTASLSIVRSTPVLTMLADGRVLVTGGRNSGATVATAEIYNPDTGLWTNAASMAGAREGHTATLLPSGKVLVAAGFQTPGPGRITSAELYDPISNTWTSTGSVATPRSGHTATLLPDGTVLVAGGYGNAGAGRLSSAERYDPAGNNGAGSWTGAGTMLEARHEHTATLLLNGTVLMAGGENPYNSSSLSTELYDPQTRLWVNTTFLWPSYGVRTTLLPNGKVLAAAGVDSSYHPEAQLYDSNLGFADTWRPALTSVTSPLVLGNAVEASGSQFKGLSEASGGNTYNGSSNYPIVRLRSLANGQTRTLELDPAEGWSDTSFTSLPVSDFPQGYALATVFTNGIPSVGQFVLVTDGSCNDVFELSAASHVRLESAGTATITVTHTAGCAATVAYSTANNTAVSGSDYTATSGTLSFAAGEISKTFAVPIVDDALVEGEETVEIRLTSPSAGAVLGQRRRAILTIVDDDDFGTLAFSAASYSAGEAAGTTTVTVNRTGGAEGTVTVPWTAATNTATVGTDVTGTTGGTLTFGPGVTSATFTLAIAGDTTGEGNESVHLSLGAPAGGAQLGLRRRAILTIVDDDVPTTGFSFSAASFTNTEGGSATITVTRTSSTTAQNVTVSTSDNGTAVAGSDYTSTSTVVSFAVGQTSRTVGVPILGDTVSEGDESVNLTLSSPTSGGTLGAQRRAVLTITDNDSFGFVEFANYVVTVNEASATATITVRRVGGLSGTVDVTYQTSNQSAKAGGDYTGVGPTTLTLLPGQASATFTVPILNDTTVEGIEGVNLTLTNPTGGAQLGGISRSVLLILDDEVVR
jgi:N-acetylneuraminic acid mutarotase